MSEGDRLEQYAAPTPGAFSAGPFGSAVSSKHFVDDGLPMLRGSNLSIDVGVRLDETDLVYLPDDYALQYPRSLVKEGDLLFTCWGTVGQIGLVGRGAHDQYLISNKQMKMTPDRSRVDPVFLYYYLSQPSMISLVQASAIGSSVPGFNLGQLRALPVRVPDLDVQRGIAEVLGALDDKIEANRKLAATADDLAVAEFRLAARDVSLSDSTFADVASIGGGGTPRSRVAEYWGGDVQWLTPTDVTGLVGPYISETSRTITEAGLDSISSPLYPVGSIAMTSRATIGAFAILDVPMAVNQGFIVVQPNDPSMRYWLFHEMRRRTNEFLDHANGATFMELSRGNFRRLRVHLAAPAAMSAFNIKAEALHNLARIALRENDRLRSLRDTLLPQLMAGALEVREAHQLVADVV